MVVSRLPMGPTFSRIHKPSKLPEIARSGTQRISGGVRAGVAALLAVSLGCNITALILPFMRLRVGLTVQPYSLVHSVQMLWNSHLQVLAVLVAGFSILFPFVKWSVLAWLVGRGEIDRRGRNWLLNIDRLGKWSMLDVFLVCLILALSSGQLFVGARPLLGLTVFVGAIVLSMTAGEILSATLPHAAPPGPVSVPAFRRSGVWLACSAVALAGAIGLPFLRIHDWFVADKAYSVAVAAPKLAVAGAPLAGAIVGLFLIALPVITCGLTCAWWLRARLRRPAPALYRLMRMGKRWSMLDVFGLALAVFAVEGENLMKTQVRWGALFIAALVAAQYAMEAALGRAFARD